MWNSSRSLWLGDLLPRLVGAAGTFSEEVCRTCRTCRTCNTCITCVTCIIRVHCIAVSARTSKGEMFGGRFLFPIGAACFNSVRRFVPKHKRAGQAP